MILKSCGFQRTFHLAAPLMSNSPVDSVGNKFIVPDAQVKITHEINSRESSSDYDNDVNDNIDESGKSLHLRLMRNSLIFWKPIKK